MRLDEDFSEFVDARYSSLVRTAVLLGAGLDHAEDVVQSALIRSYRAWDKVREAQSPDAYVYKILVNDLAKSRRRRWWGETPGADVGRDQARDADPADGVALALTLRSALKELSVEHRAVLVLRFFADLSERQAAEALGVPVGTVKSRTARALAALVSNPAVGALNPMESEHHA